MRTSIFRYDQITRQATLQLEDGPWAGRRWSVDLSVCPNPLCGCPNVDFKCTLDAPDSETILRFSLDVEKQRLSREGGPKPSHESLAFGKAVAAQLQEKDWLALSEYLFDEKQAQIDNADVTQLDANFPDEVMAGEACMVGYVEVFPLARRFPFETESECWIADDQYCVNPDCACKEVWLTFIRVPDETSRIAEISRDDPAGRYHYERGEIEEGNTPAAGLQEFAELCRTLKQAHPELNQELKKRHLQLRAFMKKALEREGWEESVEDDIEPDSAVAASPAALKAPARVGRNDPCPCGSGKKYKKCCGA